MPKRRRSKRRGPLKYRLLACICVPILLLLLLDSRLRPVMLANACNRAKSLSVQAIDSAVSKTLEELSVEYESFIRVDYDDGGSVKSVQANATPINRVKTAVGMAVSDALAGGDIQEFSVPLGTLLGTAMLSGRGPSVVCRVMTASAPIVTLDSTLTDAGINQTLHRIDLKVSVPVTVTLPMQTNTISVENTFLLAQTVLIGDIPDSYTKVISDPEMAGFIFDYADLE